MTNKKIEEEIYKELEEVINRTDVLPLDWAMDRIRGILEQVQKQREKDFDDILNKIDDAQEDFACLEWISKEQAINIIKKIKERK